MKTSDLRDFWQLCGKPERVVWAVAQHEGKRSICLLEKGAYRFGVVKR